MNYTVEIFQFSTFAPFDSEGQINTHDRKHNAKCVLMYLCFCTEHGFIIEFVKSAVYHVGFKRHSALVNKLETK